MVGYWPGRRQGARAWRAWATAIKQAWFDLTCPSRVRGVARQKGSALGYHTADCHGASTLGHRAAGGKSLESLESLNNDKATMEVQLAMQQKLLTEMRTELALSKEHKAMAESSAGTRSTQVAARVGSVCASLYVHVHVCGRVA